MKQVVEALVLPPGGLYLLTLLGFALVAAGRRQGTWRWLRPVGRLAVACGLGLIVLLSTPYVAFHLLDSLQTSDAIPPSATTLDAEAIVVLSGDVDCDPPEYGPDQPGALSMMRCRYGAALARRTGLPLLIAGGVLRPDRRPVSHVLADFVTDELSVPVRWTEDRSLDTRQNARFSAELLRGEGIQRVALVTHAWHMPRARRAFERAGLEVLPAPTDAATPPSKPIEGLLPRSRSLRDSSWAIHEWVGRAYYRFTE